MASLHGLSSYLHSLEERNGWEITINDFTGVLRSDTEFAQSYLSHAIHRNVFCMAVKTHRDMWNTCLSQKQLLKQRCEAEGGAFSGMCYCGREEITVPVYARGKAIASISVGGFTVNRAKAERRLRKSSRTYVLKFPDFQKKQQAASSSSTPPVSSVAEDLAIAVEYLSLYYRSVAQDSVEAEINPERSRTHHFLAHAVEYAKKHFCEPIGVHDVADLCHCSVSYVNHTFKRHTGVGFRRYVNGIRVSRGEVLLANSDRSVTDIAGAVGFDDPDYFSRVFRDITGQSPRAYRRSLTGGREYDSLLTSLVD